MHMVHQNAHQNADQHTDLNPELLALAERFWQFQRFEFPLTALLAGQPNDDATLFREAPADHERRADAAGQMLADLARIPQSGLHLQDRITHRLLQRELDDLRSAFATLSHCKPWLLPAGPEFNTIYFANSTHIGGAAAAERYADRLATLPAYFEAIQACLRQGLALGVRYPRVVLDAALPNLQSAMSGPADASPWYGPFKRSPAAAQAGVLRAAQRAHSTIAQAIVPALQALHGTLQNEVLPQARHTVACQDDPQGAEFYAFWVRHFTTTATATPQAIHTLGLAEVARLEAEIAAVAQEAGFAGNVPGYRQWLAQDPQFLAPTADALRQQCEVVCKRIDAKLPGFFGRLPRMSYGVQSMPLAMAERMPPAYAQPNPADGSAAGTFWVSSLPDKAPSYMHVPLALHEGWPGHLMHIALMQEMTELPAFRRANFTKYSACLEGWALYCETLGIEMGLYDTPHQHYGRLDMEMWRACRLVVDTGLHAHGWSREQAVNYMLARLSLSRTTVEAEVDRYIALPAQALGYQVGNLKFRELRQRAEQQLGERFDRRAFHDQLMAAGPVTLPVLEEVVGDWIAQQLH
jgi:uncharacterized protein (DUF885 family)